MEKRIVDLLSIIKGLRVQRLNRIMRHKTC